MIISKVKRTYLQKNTKKNIQKSYIVEDDNIPPKSQPPNKYVPPHLRSKLNKDNDIHIKLSRRI